MNGLEQTLPSAVVTIVREPSTGEGHASLSCMHALLDLCITPRPANLRGAYAECGGRSALIGDIFFVPPDSPLQLRWEGGEAQQSIRCELRGRLARDRFGSMKWTIPRMNAALDISSQTIRLLLRRLAEEARNPQSDSLLLVESIATQLTIELVRYFEENEEGAVHGGLAPWRLRVIDERLACSLPPPNLQELAEICGLSVRQLTRAFQCTTGCTVGQYVADNRLERVKRLLAGRETIKEIAQRVGFASTSSMGSAFHRATGVSPGHYRQRIWRSGAVRD